MSNVLKFEAGGYRYVDGVFQYSAGVAAEPGFRLRRVRFTEPVPLAAGFAAVERHITAAGRPTMSRASVSTGSAWGAAPIRRT